jgi:hypothetical protein
MRVRPATRSRWNRTLAYDVAAWGGFLTAASAVSGVLLGLMITAVTVRISLIQTDVPFARRNYQLLIILFDTLIYALVPLAPIHRIAIGVIVAIFGVAALYHFAYFLFASEPRAGSPAPKVARVPNTGQAQPRPASSWISRNTTKLRTTRRAGWPAGRRGRCRGDGVS